MSRRGRRSRAELPRNVQVAGTLALTVVVAVFAAAVVLNPPGRLPLGESRWTPPAEEVTSTPDPIPAQPVAEAVGRLDDRERPWSMAVLGDSTGNDGNEWVALLAQDVAERHGRPVTVQRWSVADGAYTDTWEFGDGDGAPVTIWNGSAPGLSSDYSAEELPTMLPGPVDLIVVNHGHNHADAAPAVSGVTGLIRAGLSVAPDAAAVVVLQNPQVGATADRHARVVRGLREWFTGTAVGTVDVHGAFEATGDVPALLLDDLHPNPDGSALWAATVRDTLGL